MTWSIGLEGRGVVVTGAAGGIGRAIAAQFADAGARVCAVDIEQGKVDEVVAGLADPERHLAIGADLADLTAHETRSGGSTRSLTPPRCYGAARPSTTSPRRTGMSSST